MRNSLRTLLAVVMLLPGASAAGAAHARTPDARVGALFTGPAREGHPAREGRAVEGEHFCTASVVHSRGRALIATAGHCLDGGGDFLFVPGYEDGRAPHGVWTVERLYVQGRWTDGADPDADLAFAVLAPLDGRRIEDVVGAYPWAPGPPGGRRVTVTGYPGARDAPLTCTGTATAFGAAQQRIECPGYTGSTSGSPRRLLQRHPGRRGHRPLPSGVGRVRRPVGRVCGPVLTSVPGRRLGRPGPTGRRRRDGRGGARPPAGARRPG
ncbi:trypsin-like serine peptidase [Streptomyces sp. SP18CS02]|uniref:trypsin-like serine peptidase n=1 Tax=Streptomyces sp. SP18CS02 TaxID=3002531 RepID=UPI002E771A78|nr:serine protease [Streptomyces sp. SP18CS02]MEE1755541.1 serine protease [Streptomyces sp. SP18CS02]